MDGKFIVGIHPLIKSLIMLVLHLILIITRWSPVVNILNSWNIEKWSHLSLAFITLITIWLGQEFQRKYMNLGMVFKNIEYMNGGTCFENLSRTSVLKSIGRSPPPGIKCTKMHSTDPALTWFVSQFTIAFTILPLVTPGMLNYHW
jgi:hypothetical protein